MKFMSGRIHKYGTSVWPQHCIHRSFPAVHCGAAVWLCEAKFCCSTTNDLRSCRLKRKDGSFRTLMFHCSACYWQLKQILFSHLGWHVTQLTCSRRLMESSSTVLSSCVSSLFRNAGLCPGLYSAAKLLGNPTISDEKKGHQFVPKWTW